MYKLFSVMLVAVAVSTPAYADVFGIYSSHVGPEQMMGGQVYAPAQNVVVDGSMHGYPFYGGCCEPKGSCYDGLWDGYCGGKGCGIKAPRVRHHSGLKGGCGCDIGCGMAFGHGSCGKGGCGYPPPYQFGGKSSWPGHLGHRGHGGKGGCGIGAPCGGKACMTCDPSGPKHCRLGLFDWLHYGHGHGHGCSVCGGVGCSSCYGGKGVFGKGDYIEQSPVQGQDNGYYGTPTEAYEESTLQPPEVLVEPTSSSDRSAWRRDFPVNPFARTLSY